MGCFQHFISFLQPKHHLFVQPHSIKMNARILLVACIAALAFIAVVRGDCADSVRTACQDATSACFTAAGEDKAAACKCMDTALECYNAGDCAFTAEDKAGCEVSSCFFFALLLLLCLVYSLFQYSLPKLITAATSIVTLLLWPLSPLF